MSLINDALKRASESDRSRSAQAPLPRVMQPAAEAAPRDRSSWLLAAIAAAVLGLAVAAWFLWQSLVTGRPPVAASPVRPALTTAAVAPPPAPKPTSINQENLPIPSAPVPSPAVAAAPVVVAADVDAWPTNLTVTAIFYSKTSPRALVNGKTVGTGDEVDGVLVTGILSDRVFFDWNGKSKEVLLGAR